MFSKSNRLVRCEHERFKLAAFVKWNQSFCGELYAYGKDGKGIAMTEHRPF
jgi:hypothetical protein